MFKSIHLLVLSLLIISFLSCKNDTAKTSGDASPTADEQPKNVTGGVGNINFISKEKIVLNPSSEIILPKEGDTSSVVFYLATPAENAEGKSGLSENGLLRSQILTMTMAKAGLTIVYVDGNSALQTATQLAAANAAELNTFKEEKAIETMKILSKNYRGKRVMVCAKAPIISMMVGQLTGQPSPAVPDYPNNNIYVIVSKGIGDGKLNIINY